MIDKNIYAQFCQNQEDLPIFMQNWWLDAVCTEGGIQWEGFLIAPNEVPTFATVFCWKKKWGIKYAVTPPLTKYTGTWQADSVLTLNHERQNEEHSFLKSFINQLPDFQLITLHLLLKSADWSPFAWAGFEQTTRYVQVIAHDKNNPEAAFQNVNRNTKRNVKKAQTHLTVSETDDFSTFWALHQNVFDRRHNRNTVPLSIWQRLDAALNERGQRKILLARDANGTAHGAFYLIWDKQYAYALANGLSEEGRNWGAMSLLTWAAIEEGFKKGLDFNFLGSMMPAVEQFNRGFNALKMPYFVLTRKRWLGRIMSFLQG